jgi:hypothetical protein
MATRRPGDFRARARAEADRYGPDPWVFVRELLQNARDAGATLRRLHLRDRRRACGACAAATTARA